MGEKIKRFWYDWIPGWMPITGAILGGAFWVGQYTARVDARLKALEGAVQEIQNYVRYHGDAIPLPPISDNQPPDKLKAVKW